MQERTEVEESSKATTFVNISANGHYLFHFLKRIFDILFGVLGFSVFVLLYCSFWAANRVQKDQGPVLYKQQRIGLNGKSFGIYKFRSMKVNAEQILKSDPDLYEKYINNNYKLSPEEDPRITKIGKFIRKTSLDEFPQFINVLIGNMSIVGPRPIVKKELEEYGSNVKKFIELKPGITGIWSSTGRSEIGYPDRCELELEYGAHHNIFYDFQIVLRTVIKVVKKEGAY